MRSPKVTIITSTYNLSAALPYTIQSALSQTFEDFEMLIVGDACTDDSEAVVRSFTDSRIQWFNLPQRCGSQYGPNNFGLERARGEYVAYLGHDDLWWPGHLETGLRTLQATRADMVVAVAIIYGPPESGFKAVTGLFPNDTYTPRYDFIPASMMHTRALVDRAGPWRSPQESEVGVDHDFVTRCHRAGARIVPTKDVTVFKFSTTYRRNAYLTGSVRDHADLFARMQAGGEEFRRTELVGVLKSVVEDRFMRIEGLWNDAERAKVDAAYLATRYLRFKAAGRDGTTALATLGEGRIRFSVGNDFGGFEWHSPESDPVHGHFRWTGPSTDSLIPLPVALTRPVSMTLHILSVIDPDVLSTLAVLINGRPVATTLTATQTGTWLVECPVDPPEDTRGLEIMLRVQRTVRPFDMSPSPDRRWLGVAVNWIELAGR